MPFFRVIKKIFFLFLSLGFPTFAYGAVKFFGEVSGFCEYWKKIFDFSVASAGILTVLALMFGGLYYLVSLGSKEKIARAKDIMTGSVAGFVLILLGWTIFNTVAPRLTQCKIEVELVKLKGDLPLSPEEIEEPPQNPCAGLPEEKLFATKEECEASGGENNTECKGFCVEGKLEVEGKKSDEIKWCCRKEALQEVQTKAGCIQNPVYYKQGGNTPWANKNYGNCPPCKDKEGKEKASTMANAGCGPTSFS